MHTIKSWPVAAAFAAINAIPLSAWAQQADNATSPPTLEKLEGGEAPEITIRKPEQRRQITEDRAPGGRVTDVRVTNGKSTYYLKPNTPAGSALPGDTQSNTARAPQWRVLEFDLNRSQEAKEAQEAAAASTPPPPQPSPAPAQK